MSRLWYKLTQVLLLSVLLVLPALAGNGKITGVVKDANGDPAVGANVTIEGTVLGGSADVQGMYFILNVPPGTYAIRASAVGFTPKVLTDVSVGPDQIVSLSFTLQTEAVGLAEVVVQAERPLVDRSLTSSKTTMRSEDIQDLPVRSAVGLVGLSASAFNGFIRGGKINETKTIIDGVDISDQYYAAAGDQTVSSVFNVYNSVPRFKGSELSTLGDVNVTSVEQLNVNTGAVGAEYSSATAGVLNYSLREGRGPLSGNFVARVSQFDGLKYSGPDIYWNENIYFSERNALQGRVDSLRQVRAGGGNPPTLAADSARLGRYTYTSGKYINEKPQLEFEGSVGGDISEGWGFYLSGKYFDSYGRLPNEHNRELNLTLKSQYQITHNLKLSGFGIVTDRGKLFGWKNTAYQELARFFLEGVPKNDGADIIGSLKATHILSPSSFYEVQLSYTSSNSRLGYSDDNGDGFAALDEDGDYITLETLDQANKYISNTDLSKFFRNQDEPQSSTNYQFNAGTIRLARPGFYYENFKNNVFTVKGDITDQVTSNHQLRGGFQARMHDLDMVRRSSYLGAIDARKQFYTEQWNVKPVELGFYAQDRMEYAGLIINIGARVDTWNPDGNDFTNYFAPYNTVGVAIDTIPGQTVTVQDRVTQRDRSVDTYVLFSPRIGVSHPISDVAAMYFSYSHNALPPPYSRVYAFYNNFGNISLPNVPTVRQEPYKSSNYEIGVQWEFLPRVGLDFTAYLRDIENYGWAGFQIVPRSGPTGVTYGIATSAGYADSRGVEVTLTTQQQRVADFLTVYGQATYAYTYIKASSFAGLDATMPTSFSTANGDSARLGGDLPFDDLQFYNKVQTNVVGNNSTLTGGYDRTHRITYQFIMSFPADIRLSSTGTFQSGFFYPLTQVDPRVASRELGEAPWNKMVNIRLEKGFDLGGVRCAVFADVQNLFNWTNIIAYDQTATGSVLWETSSKEGDPDPTGTTRRPVGPDGSLFYDIPREFYFGVRLNF